MASLSLEYVLSILKNLSDNPDERASSIKEMFSRLAPRYDLVNSALSLSLHSRWRRYAVKRAELQNGDSALDVCCGTGDFAFELIKTVGLNGRVVGVDFCNPMLEIARSKANRAGYASIQFINSDAVHLPFDDEEFNCVTIGFGIRNITRPVEALQEMLRVLKPGGRFICLEASKVKNKLVMPFWRVYFCKLTPFVAWLFGGDISAYKYLPDSVMEFYTREEFCKVLDSVGFTDVSYHDLAFGAASLHIARKP